MYIATSTDDGATWNLAPGNQHFIGQGALDLQGGGIMNYKEGFFDRQWLAVDNTNGPNSGALYASFLFIPGDNDPSKFGTSIRKMPAGATAFGPTITTVFNGEGQFSNIAVDNSGKVLVSLADEGDDIVYQATSSNGGTSFTLNAVANAARLAGVQASNPTDFVHNRENGATSMAVDGSGNIHMVWTSYPTTGVEAYYSRSTNSGATWSAPVNLNTWFPNRVGFMPTVAAYGNKVTVSVAAVGADDSSLYYQVYSNDGGQTFGTPFAVTSVASNYKSFTGGASNDHFFGDYNASVRTACTSFSAWSEGRPGEGAKIYIARNNICATGVPEVSAVTGNVQLQSVYPNPATTAFSIQLSAGKAAATVITLTDMAGRVVSTQNAMLHAGAQMVSLPIKAVAGNYVLSVRDEAGLIGTRFVQVK